MALFISGQQAASSRQRAAGSEQQAAGSRQRAAGSRILIAERFIHLNACENVIIIIIIFDWENRAARC